MSQNYWPVGDRSKNIHFRSVREIQGPPQHGRGAGVNKFRETYHRVKRNVYSGIVVFARN